MNKHRFGRRMVDIGLRGRLALLIGLAAGAYSCTDMEDGDLDPDGDAEMDVATAEAAQTATAWGQFGGHIYALYADRTSWESARAHCEHHGGHLVTFSSSAEVNYVKSLTANRGIPRVWIGFTDQVAEGVWRWITGETVTYTQWSSGEPNNVGGAENFAIMYPSSGNWVDLPATWTASHVCEYGSHGYRLVETSRHWTDAAEDCEARGGYLATVGSASENSVVKSLLSQSAVSHGWIGYTDEDDEGTFQWVTGEPSAYTNWNSGEPNNANGGEDYAEIRPWGVWNDLPDGWSIPAVCEFGRPAWNALVTLDFRPSNGDDYADQVTCLPWASGGGSCKSCPAGSIEKTLTTSQQNASAQAKYLIVEKGQGVREPESQFGYNFVSLELVNASGQVSTEFIEFGDDYENELVNYRPNGDVVVSLSSVLSGGKKIRKVSYVENYSLSILCNMGPPSTATYYYSRILLAN